MQPPSLRIAYYGDDFTGSTDVMEALARAGLRTVLFLSPPTAHQLARHPGIQAFGIAGGSRTMSPAEMERDLPPAFAALRDSGAPLIHYKICSTFDSAPEIGSIGKAIELGRAHFGDRPTPLVVGAPVLGRYVVFGNLFARSGLDSEPYRLDRHPTMRCHPVTPMGESDLRLVLAQQTRLPVQLVDVLKLEAMSTEGEFARSAPAAPAPILLFDTVNPGHLPLIGRRILDLAAGGVPLFCVGSSGMEYALTAAWPPQSTASFPPAPHPVAPLPRLDQPVLAVSGSCSPVTDQQIERALTAGFGEVPVQLDQLLEPTHRRREQSRLRDAVRVHAQTGRSLIVSTSRAMRSSGDVPIGVRRSELNRIIGESLADLLSTWVQARGRSRLVVCGGDTSTSIARALGIETLEYLGPMAPGSPRCRVQAPGQSVDGCEIVFKGGQVGRDSFFLDFLAGGPGRE